MLVLYSSASGGRIYPLFLYWDIKQYNRETNMLHKTAGQNEALYSHPRIFVYVRYNWHINWITDRSEINWNLHSKTIVNVFVQMYMWLSFYEWHNIKTNSKITENFNFHVAAIRYLHSILCDQWQDVTAITA